jgi:uncharacterized protein DUF4167
MRQKPRFSAKGERAGKIMRNGQKRMRGRNNHHRKSQNPLTRVYESNGPDVTIRGTASHVAEKYIQLARDAQSSGDPVAAENYYQHAEHYFRLIAAAQEQFRQQNPYYNQQQQQPGGPQGGNPAVGNDDGDDFGDDDAQPFMGQNEPSYAPQPAPQAQPYLPRDAQPFPPREQQVTQQGGRPQNQPQPGHGGDNGQDGGLPAFITGGQPQPQQQQQNAGGSNGHDQDRFGGRHRRRRHRGGYRGDFGNNNQQGNAPQSMPNEGNDDRQPE